MKIVKLHIDNFRGFVSTDINLDEKFNVIVGKNDVGKSTILEAFEIFFNNSTVKIDLDDLCKFSDEDYVEIGVSFKLDNFDLRIDTIPTSLVKEYLLDDNGFLTIIKRWDCSKKTITKSSEKIFIKANYPKAIGEPLICLKNAELKSKIDELFGDNIPTDVNKRINSTMRLAIYDFYGKDTEIDLGSMLIEVNKEDAKKVWDNLEKDIPLFFLFQSDRANKDSDKEVQDPLKAITKLAISEVQQDLERVINRIEELVTEITQDTIDKMQEMDSDLAKSLKPSLSQKNWDSLFSFSFIGDNEVPINKRGSGFRRLLLLNYFRAEAERANESRRPVIYAIEEPETALHPNWQAMLISSLLELSDNNTQVIITTHSPALASTVNYEYIRFIKKEDNIHYVKEGSKECLDEVCSTLGIMTNIPSSDNYNEIKVILCLEGINDIQFFYNISNLFEIDLRSDSRILVLPLGGNTLMEWVNKQFLDKLPLPQIHIYDNDVETYQKAIDATNNREDGSFGCLTNMIEMENYIHPVLIKNIYEIDDDYFINNNERWRDQWVSHDIPKELNSFLKDLSERENREIKNHSTSKIKSKFAQEAAKLMTTELLEDLNAYDEVNGWFNKIKSYL